MLQKTLKLNYITSHYTLTKRHLMKTADWRNNTVYMRISDVIEPNVKISRHVENILNVSRMSEYTELEYFICLVS